MFARYTEQARRTIFFARFEASHLRSRLIDTDHLLLGLIREDTALQARLGLKGQQEIRHVIETQSPAFGPEVPPSVDLPLAEDAKRALVFGAEEAEGLGHTYIDCGHLVLGLLRLEGNAAGLLQSHGIELNQYRGSLAGGAPPTDASVRGKHRWPKPGPTFDWGNEIALAPLLQGTLEQLAALIIQAVEQLQMDSEPYPQQRLKRKPWTRKQAMGHLIDWAVTHQQWTAVALTEPKLLAPEYPQDGWVLAQRYDAAQWRDLVNAWVAANRILLHSFLHVPAQKLATPCRIGLDQPIALSKLIENYVGHCEDVVAQILSKL